MDPDLLVSGKINEGAEIIRLFNESIPVRAAFWLKLSEEERWRMHIASEKINYSNDRDARMKLLSIIDEADLPYLELFDFKLIRMDNPLAKDAIESLQKYRGRHALRFGGKSFGNEPFREVYIYRLEELLRPADAR